ncbi:MAG: copper chaperone PCu(A)C [Salaquimonas sp.]
MKIKLTTILLSAALLLPTSLAFADQYEIGSLEIYYPQARATLPGAPVSGGYMTIKNAGDTSDRLVSASVDFAGKTEIHEMAMENDVMKMRQLVNGIEIPAGDKVILKPGGYHLMFMKLKEQLKEGEKRKAILIFEKAGTIEIEFVVEQIETMKKMGH